MTLTVQLPDDLIQHDNPARDALEALALEGYESGAFSQSEARLLVGMGRLEFEGLLKAKNLTRGQYDLEGFLQDLRTLNELHAEEPVPE